MTMATRALKAKIIKRLKDLDGMAFDYELYSDYSVEEVDDAIEELIQDGWIYRVRRQRQ